MENIWWAKITQKNARVRILVPDKINLKVKSTVRSKDFFK